MMNNNVKTVSTDDGFVTINFDKLIRAEYVEDDERHATNATLLELEFAEGEPISLRRDKAEDVAHLIQKWTHGIIPPKKVDDNE
jgi:hypothetical protein